MLFGGLGKHIFLLALKHLLTVWGDDGFLVVGVVEDVEGDVDPEDLSEVDFALGGHFLELALLLGVGQGGDGFEEVRE